MINDKQILIIEKCLIGSDYRLFVEVDYLYFIHKSSGVNFSFKLEEGLLGLKIGLTDETKSHQLKKLNIFSKTNHITKIYNYLRPFLDRKNKINSLLNDNRKF